MRGFWSYPFSVQHSKARIVFEELPGQCSVFPGCSAMVGAEPFPGVFRITGCCFALEITTPESATPKACPLTLVNSSSRLYPGIRDQNLSSDSRLASVRFKVDAQRTWVFHARCLIVKATDPGVRLPSVGGKMDAVMAAPKAMVAAFL